MQFYPNKPCDLRVMSILLTTINWTDAQLSLAHLKGLLRMPMVRQCWHTYMHTYAKFDQNIPSCGPRGISFFTYCMVADDRRTHQLRVCQFMSKVMISPTYKQPNVKKLFYGCSVVVTGTRPGRLIICVVLCGVSTQLQSSGLVAHENSTFWNLALAVSVSLMDTPFVFKRVYDLYWSICMLMMMKNASLCSLFCHRLPSQLTGNIWPQRTENAEKTRLSR